MEKKCRRSAVGAVGAVVCSSGVQWVQRVQWVQWVQHTSRTDQSTAVSTPSTMAGAMRNSICKQCPHLECSPTGSGCRVAVGGSTLKVSFLSTSYVAEICCQGSHSQKK